MNKIPIKERKFKAKFTSTKLNLYLHEYFAINKNRMENWLILNSSMAKIFS